jgi:uncharacterized Zn-binding protein involved in type VI secretion
MPAAQRVGDADTGGGVITASLQSHVFCNGALVAVNGSPVSGHVPGGVHAAPRTASGSSTVFIKGIPVNRTGDADTCGHPRAAGSPNVFVG